MYLLKLEGVTDDKILKNVYTSIDCFHMEKDTFIIYELKDFISNIPEFRRKVIMHALMIDFNLYENYSADEIENLILDIIELNTTVIVKEYVGNNQKYLDTLKGIIDDFGFKYIIYGDYRFDKKIDLNCLTYNEYQIILEILEQQTHKKYYAKNFMIRLSVDEDGLLRNEENGPILDLRKDKYYEIINITLPKVKEKMDQSFMDYISTKQLSTCWYEPFLFIFQENHDLSNKIIDYKYKVFDAIKNIAPEDYQLVPMELLNILNEKGYIPMDAIKKIIING